MIVSTSRSSQGEAALNDFEKIFTAMLCADQTNTVMPWKHGYHEGLTKSNIHRCMPTNKRELLVYVDRCFLKDDSYPYICFEIGHIKKRKYLNSEEMKAGLYKHSIHVHTDKI